MARRALGDSAGAVIDLDPLRTRLIPAPTPDPAPPTFDAPAFDAPTYYLPREPYQPTQPAPRPDRDRPDYYDDRSPTEFLPSVPPRAVRPPDRSTSYRPPPPPARRQPTRPYEPPDPDYDQGYDEGSRHDQGFGYGAGDSDSGAFGRPPGAPLPAATTVGPSTSAAAVPKVTVTRAVAARSGRAAQTVARRVVAASRANGASESGLTQLIWNQVLSFGADAMVTVALAGTVFFSATGSQQKGNVLSYLLITMAPFAVVAPVIGPVLDRLQHGRRWAMAASGFGRALLAVLMAQNFHNLYLLFPLALGSLVLSKGYSVVRAAAAPRLVPPDMTLVTANARLSIFGLGAAVVGGGFIAAVVRVTGSYPLGLWVTAIGFAVTGYFALRLPSQVDSAAPARQHPEEPRRPVAQVKVPPIKRIQTWVSKGFGRQVITSMQGESALRWTAGFLTMFLAFYIEKTSHGFEAASSLGAVGAAVAVGNVIGTGAGARFKLGHPHVIVVACSGVCALACVLTAASFRPRDGGGVHGRLLGRELFGKTVARRGHPARCRGDAALERLRPIGDVPPAGVGARRRGRAPAAG